MSADDEKPIYISLNPRRLTAGALVEVIYRTPEERPDIVVNVEFLAFDKRQGRETRCMFASINLDMCHYDETAEDYRQLIDVPEHAETIRVSDSVGRSRILSKKIAYVSRPRWQGFLHMLGIRSSDSYY